MGFRELEIAPAYETFINNPVENFFLPVLGESVSYKRIAGYFNSSSLALAARGIGGLIANGGKMQLITSPYLSSEDASVIKQVISNPVDFEEIINPILIRELDNFEDEFFKDHVAALGWMLSNKLLEIKLAVFSGKAIDNSGQLFHQKVGIMEDTEGAKVSFSGSGNETASGWLTNIEEFKVFKSWEPGPYFGADEDKFSSFWDGHRDYVRMVSLPEAVSERIVEIGNNFRIDKLALEHYKSRQYCYLNKPSISLFGYQEEAKKQWANNNYQLLLEMATGTGKTRTAVASALDLLKANSKLLIIVATPQSTLSMQWKSEFSKWTKIEHELTFDKDSGANKLDKLRNMILRLKTGFIHSAAVYTTHSSASSEVFINVIKEMIGNIPVLFIGDETHGLGSEVHRRALLEEYKYRIGLSATPSRWFDDEGSALIENYYGGKKFVFSIYDALHTDDPRTGKPFLTPYEYIPIFVDLNITELENYIQITKQIIKLQLCAEDNEDSAEMLQRALFRRANIVKDASNKLPALKHIFEKENVEKTLIFSSPGQIDTVMQILNENGISARRFTQEQGQKPEARFGGKSERQHIITLFENGIFSTLVAMRCLNEGIDIPSATNAIIMSSSTNPMEYIQRVGRVIRTSPGKKKAKIFDFIVAPNPTYLSTGIIGVERSIIEKELIRVNDMAKNAINYIEVISIISERLRGYKLGN